jgi:alkyl hydroperoxide reductase subunit AhpC
VIYIDVNNRITFKENFLRSDHLDYILTNVISKDKPAIKELFIIDNNEVISKYIVYNQKEYKLVDGRNW